MENTYALIMAGGVGSRFWPKSRKHFPKQYLNLSDSNSMIQNAAVRFRQILAAERILIVTTKEQGEIIRKQIPWLAPENIIYEPMGKNTAPAIGLSAIYIAQRNPEAKMIVAPADHMIKNTSEYLTVFKKAVSLLDQFPTSLITIGIHPTFPATGYGYIQQGVAQESGEIRFNKVKAFAEKPTLDIAQKFFESGEFLWNSGTFVWRTDTILDAIDNYMPDLYDSLLKIKNAIGTPNLDDITEKTYKEIFTESIDYGILEQADDVLVLEGNFGWNDLGSWEEVYKIAEKDEQGNVSVGDTLLKDVKNSYIESSKLVAAVGVEDLIIVDTPDALLVCNKENSQDVKWIVEKLKQSNHENLL